ncbi:MAG: hypothetical protein RMM07_12230, partial [Anaerolineae bacterium]|nr:hypothetical protein [Anaerolineae bacterium]
MIEGAVFEVLKTLFSTAAQTVFDLLVREFGLVDRVGAIRRIDPERKALQNALARACRDFNRRYPKLAPVLTRFLKTEEAARMLARLLTSYERPDPAELARHYVAQHPGGWPPESIDALADFIRQVMKEADEDPVLRALRDLDALRRIAEDVSAIRRAIEEGHRAVQEAVQTFFEVLLRSFVQPLFSLPTDYATPIRNFMIEYLGTPDRPVPFGGRSRELAELNRWLEDPAAPYLLLTAPAGRGKSSLLVQWIARLRADRSDLHIAFVPLSVRFGTNRASVAFAALAVQLAEAFSEPVPTGANTPDVVWQGICSSYLNREPAGPLLVVLDGVDEAADWESNAGLFPLDPPSGLKVVLSARRTLERPTASAWLQALGWDRPGLARMLELGALSREGIADVLRQAGFPPDRAGSPIDLVAELHRLSEGDPLLVRLYVEDLIQRPEAAPRLRPEDLRGLQPGYKGYVERWWEEQRRLWGKDAPLREPDVREVLNLLSAAMGPLTKDDLLSLARLGGVELDSWTLEEALRPLARFVLRTDEGYAFGHPRMAEYFFGRLSTAERQELERRFLSWGQEVLEALRQGRIAASEAPAYVVRYYRAHLDRAQRPLEAYRPLVETAAWGEAWHWLEGSYSGYLGDVRGVWERAREENRRAAEEGQPAPQLGLEVRCALIEASVRSVSGNMPPELIVALVEKGVWDPRIALAYVHQIPDEENRGRALSALVKCLRGDLVFEAMDIARQIQNKGVRAQALATLAPHLPEGQQEQALREAIDAVREIQDEWACVQALAALAPYLSEELLREALDVA